MRLYIRKYSRLFFFIYSIFSSAFKQYIGTVIDKDKPLKNRYNNLDKVTELKTKTDYKVKYTVIPVRLVCLLIKIDLARNNFKSVKGFTIFKLNQVKKQLNNKGIVYQKGIYKVQVDELKGNTLRTREQLVKELIEKINKEGI
jgi:hypothetical protein